MTQLDRSRLTSSCGDEFLVAECESCRKLVKTIGDGTVVDICSLPMDHLDPVSITLQHDLATDKTYYVETSKTNFKTWLYEVDKANLTFTLITNETSSDKSFI